nr:MAG TPA: hypothetical protein [Caudoviricetes sp.]
MHHDAGLRIFGLRCPSEQVCEQNRNRRPHLAFFLAMVPGLLQPHTDHLIKLVKLVVGVVLPSFNLCQTQRQEIIPQRQLCDVLLSVTLRLPDLPACLHVGDGRDRSLETFELQCHFQLPPSF